MMWCEMLATAFATVLKHRVAQEMCHRVFALDHSSTIEVQDVYDVFYLSLSVFNAVKVRETTFK